MSTSDSLDPSTEKEQGAAMADTTSDVPAITAEQLLGDRQQMWSGFYHFVWTVAACAAILLILMAYFLV